jgi:hypothetical protein
MNPWGWDGIFKPFVFTDLGEYITGQRKWGAKTKSQAHQKAREDASARLEKPRSHYLKDPDRMNTCKPSEALKSRLQRIMEEVVTRDEDINKRMLGLMIDDLQTPHGDDYQEATSATEYYAWNSSSKHGEKFDAFLTQMAKSIKQSLGDGETGAAHGNATTSDSEEQPIRRKRPADETMQDHSSLAEGPRQFRRLVAVDELPGEEDDEDDDEDEDEDDDDDDDSGVSKQVRRHREIEEWFGRHSQDPKFTFLKVEHLDPNVMEQLLALKSAIALGSLNYATQGGSTRTRVGSMIQFSNLMLRILSTI